MPCDSRVTETEMKNYDQMKQALEDLGYTVTGDDKRVVAKKDGDRLDLDRNNTDEGFSTSSSNIDALQAVQRKYAELGLRQWARRKGFTVMAEDDGRNFKLVNRRRG